MSPRPGPRPSLWSRLRTLVLGTRRWQPGDALGRRGERLAERHLRSLGYRILDRNVVLPMGEADLVAEHGEWIVVVEVKTRRVGSGNHPPPEASVHRDKRRRLGAILRYLQHANGWTARPGRVDVVAIDMPPRGRAIIRVWPDAVR